MKRMRILIFICVIGIIVAGCSNTNDRELEKRLLSTDSNKYSLFIVQNTNINWLDWLSENKIYNVKSVRGEASLSEARKDFKFLKLKKQPAFVVFDNKNLVFKTYSEADLVEFLQNNDPK